MKNALGKTFVIIALALMAQGCATAPKADPSKPIELDGTKWKLVAINGQLDGRVIQFKRKSKDGYEGTLVEIGRRLAGVVGLQLGTVIFTIRNKGVNQYEGYYKDITPSGNQSDRELNLSVDGDS